MKDSLVDLVGFVLTGDRVVAVDAADAHCVGSEKKIFRSIRAKNMG